MKTPKKSRKKTLKSDHPFYQFMREYPRQMFELLGASDIYREDYDFFAPVVKQTEFRPDGFYRGKDPNSPLIFIEINFYKADNIYYKTLAESWLIYSQTTDRPSSFYVFILFDKRENDPGRSEFIESFMPSPYFRVLYLDEILNKLPENPYFTLLELMVSKPDFEKDITKVKKVFQNLGEEENDYIDLCLTLLTSKYENITLKHLYAMLPNFKDQLKRSLAIQEIVAEAVEVNAQQVTEQVTQKVTQQVTQQVAREKELAFAKALIAAANFDALQIAALSGLPEAEVQKLMKANKKA